MLPPITGGCEKLFGFKPHRRLFRRARLLLARPVDTGKAKGPSFAIGGMGIEYQNLNVTVSAVGEQFASSGGNTG